MLVVSILNVSCAIAPGVRAPEWDVAERDTSVVIANPVELPALCAIPFTATECWDRLDAYEDVAVGNTAIAELAISALDKTEGAYDELVGAGKLQQHLTDFYIELLEEEKRERKYDNWFFKSVIALGLLGGSL